MGDVRYINDVTRCSRFLKTCTDHFFLKHNVPNLYNKLFILNCGMIDSSPIVLSIDTGIGNKSKQGVESK